MKACGDRMTRAGIEEGDILIVDTVIEAPHENVVIASVDNEQTVKRLRMEGGMITSSCLRILSMRRSERQCKFKSPD